MGERFEDVKGVVVEVGDKVEVAVGLGYHLFGFAFFWDQGVSFVLLNLILYGVLGDNHTVFGSFWGISLDLISL